MQLHYKRPLASGSSLGGELIRWLLHLPYYFPNPRSHQNFGNASAEDCVHDLTVLPDHIVPRRFLFRLWLGTVCRPRKKGFDQADSGMMLVNGDAAVED